MTETLNMFALMLVASFVFSAICARIPGLRIPTSISYLAFGIILHMTPIPLPEPEANWINHLGQLGLWVLMFLSGLEVNMSLVLRSHHSDAPVLGVGWEMSPRVFAV